MIKPIIVSIQGCEMVGNYTTQYKYMPYLMAASDQIKFSWENSFRKPKDVYQAS
jgi:hypothetical protein